MTAPQEKTRWLHIPMEIVDRELYPKLLLAREALARGWQCTIGTKRAMQDAAPHLPPGLLYLKSVIPSELQFMRAYKKSGHRLVCLDEEGLVQSSLDTLVGARYCADTVAETELFMCWGEIQRQALQKAYPADAAKFRETGSPTADLWHEAQARPVYDRQVADLRARFGDYILFPSSFGVPNHFMGPEEALGIMRRDNMFPTQADYDHFKSYHDYTEKVFRAFLTLIPRIARAFPDRTLIVRPHPSENHDTWRRACRDLPNIRVLFEGPVSPWLLGAAAILHWGSTTGIEGHLLNRPVIAHTPLPEEEKQFDILPHTVSIMTKTPEEVEETLRHVLTAPPGWRERYPALAAGHETLKRWIVNMDGPPAVRNVMDMLDAMDLAPQPGAAAALPSARPVTGKEMVWRCLDAAAAALPGIENILPARIGLGLKSRAFGRHKTKNIEKDEIDKALSELTDGAAAADRLADNLFRLYATR